MLDNNFFEKSARYFKAYDSLYNFRFQLQDDTSHSFISKDKEIIKEAIQIFRNPKDPEIRKKIILYSIGSVGTIGNSSVALNLAYVFKKLSNEDADFDGKLKNIEQILDGKMSEQSKYKEGINFLSKIIDEIAELSKDLAKQDSFQNEF